MISEVARQFMLAVEFHFFDQTVQELSIEMIELLQTGNKWNFSQRDLNILNDCYHFTEETQNLISEVLKQCCPGDSSK